MKMNKENHYRVASVLIIIAGLIIIGFHLLGDQSPRVAIDQESCEEVGGEWKVWGNALGAVAECNLPTSDSGKICSDSSECESYCEAPSGSEIGSRVVGECHGLELAICMQEVKGGIAEATWCF